MSDKDGAPTTATPGMGTPVPLRGIYGEDLSRILSLSDGVFAFALTLLALSLAVPTFATAGLTTRSAIVPPRLPPPAGLQRIHRLWVRLRDDRRVVDRPPPNIPVPSNGHTSELVWLNMLVLLQIAVMPFVLSVFNDYSNTQVAVDLFAGIQVSLGLTLTGLSGIRPSGQAPQEERAGADRPILRLPRALDLRGVRAVDRPLVLQRDARRGQLVPRVHHPAGIGPSPDATSPVSPGVRRRPPIGTPPPMVSGQDVDVLPGTDLHQDLGPDGDADLTQVRLPKEEHLRAGLTDAAPDTERELTRG